MDRATSLALLSLVLAACSSPRSRPSEDVVEDLGRPTGDSGSCGPCAMPPSPCHQPVGECAAGECRYEAVEDGVACDDGDESTMGDSCREGACEGTALGGWTDVALGGHHGCAVNESGAVYCWGENFDGQLGDGTTDPHRRPARVAGLPPAVQVGASSRNTCALHRSGLVSCWGQNLYGQLGDGTTTDRLTPAPVVGLTDAVYLAVGTNKACAIRETGTVVCWGFQSGGNALVPTPLPEVAGAVSLSLKTISCAILDSGRADCWGWFNEGRAPEIDNESVVSIAPGFDHVCLADAAGAVYCQGNNHSGQLGIDGGGRAPFGIVPGLTDVASVAAAQYVTCAIHHTGRASCWGDNGSGRLGDGDRTTLERHTPAPVVGLEDAVKIVFGVDHACALRASADVVCWGDLSNIETVRGDAFVYETATLLDLP